MLNWIICIRTVWLNWIAWNRNVVEIKQYLHVNCMLILNWIVWNRTVFDIETLLRLYWNVWYRTVLTFNCVWTKSVLILNWNSWIRIVWIDWITLNRNVFDN